MGLAWDVTACRFPRAHVGRATGRGCSCAPFRVDIPLSPDEAPGILDEERQGSGPQELGAACAVSYIASSLNCLGMRLKLLVWPAGRELLDQMRRSLNQQFERYR